MRAAQLFKLLAELATPSSSDSTPSPLAARREKALSLFIALLLTAFLLNTEH